MYMDIFYSIKDISFFNTYYLYASFFNTPDYERPIDRSIFSSVVERSFWEIIQMNYGTHSSTCIEEKTMKGVMRCKTLILILISAPIVNCFRISNGYYKNCSMTNYMDF